MKKIFSVIFIFVIILSGCGQTTVNNSKLMSYETENGVINYPENPKIYADYYVGQLLYLGGDVVGADMTYPSKTWTDVAEKQGVVNISGDMESVAALTPELIVTINSDLYDQYSAIAPTILIPYGTYNQEDIVIEIGKILGAEDKANKWVEEFNTNVNELKSKIDNKEQTIGIIDNWGGSMYMYGANFGRGGYILYDKLGFKGTNEAENDYIRKDNSYLTVDGESLVKYAGDVLYICAPKEGISEIENLATYKNLNAVKNNNVVILDYDTFLYDDPYSLNAQIESLNKIYDSKTL